MKFDSMKYKTLGKYHAYENSPIICLNWLLSSLPAFGGRRDSTENLQAPLLLLKDAIKTMQKELLN